MQYTDKSGKKYLFLNVYLPYECSDNYGGYMYYFGKIASIINNSDNFIYALGDFNAHINSIGCRNFGGELLSLW